MIILFFIRSRILVVLTVFCSAPIYSNVTFRTYFGYGDHFVLASLKWNHNNCHMHAPIGLCSEQRDDIH